MEFVLFSVGNIHFGIKLEDVLEIFDAPQMIGHRFLFRDRDLDVVYLSALFGIEDDFGITPTVLGKRILLLAE